MNTKQIIAETACFGKFTLSSGQTTTRYYDLRTLISNPKKLQIVIEEFNPVKSNHICGVPYGAIPLATAYSLHFGVSQIILRKEAKEHGRKQLIEGNWKSGDTVTLIDDVWTTGLNMLTTKNILEKQGLKVTKMLCVLYRGPDEDIPLNLEYLITEIEIDHLPIINFREHLHKKGKLCFAADPSGDPARFYLHDISTTVHNTQTIISQIKNLHKEISVVKIHPELIDKIDINELKKSCKDHGLMWWADIKICEVPHIAIEQLGRCAWNYNFVTVMSIVGPETLRQLNDLALKINVDLIIVPSLHSNGKLIWEDPNLDELLPVITECESIVGSVGKKIPGLIYIRAGINDDTDLSDCDLVVRGRSLMK